MPTPTTIAVKLAARASFLLIRITRMVISILTMAHKVLIRGRWLRAPERADRVKR